MYFNVSEQNLTAQCHQELKNSCASTFIYFIQVLQER